MVVAMKHSIYPFSVLRALRKEANQPALGVGDAGHEARVLTLIADAFGIADITTPNSLVQGYSLTLNKGGT